MRLNKYVVATLLLVSFTALLLAQAKPSLDSLVTILANPPKVVGVPVTEALQQISVYLSAFVMVVTVYGAQFVPVLRTFLARYGGYARTLIVGGSVLWLLFATGKITDWGAIMAFVLGTITYNVVTYAAEKLGAEIPETPTQTIAADMKKAKKIKAALMKKEV